MKQTRRAATIREEGIFSLKIGLLIIDEAHAARRINKLYMTLQELGKNAEMIVAMTATPVISHPSVSVQLALFDAER